MNASSKIPRMQWWRRDTGRLATSMLLWMIAGRRHTG
jgi:hypothetical protein